LIPLRIDLQPRSECTNKAHTGSRMHRGGAFPSSAMLPRCRGACPAARGATGAARPIDHRLDPDR